MFSLDQKGEQMSNEDLGYIAVNNDHGWARGSSADEARSRSLEHGRKATRVRIWKVVDPRAYVDGMGTVYGIEPDSAKEYQRSGPNGWKWREVAVSDT
jgi:hypothetical protein